MDKLDTIGLDEDNRHDLALRSIFVDAYELTATHLDDAGNWLTLADEMLAHDALAERFPDLTGMHLMATLATIANVRASGRTPVR